MKPLRGLLRATSGAVYVEFMAVFFPIFAFFLGLVQLMFIQTASIVTSHAAMCAARAAAVVIPDHPAYYGNNPGSASGARLADITRAAKIPLSTLGTDSSAVSVKLDSGGYQGNQLITVTVDYDFRCRVPLGNLIACGGTSKKIKATASMPNQGASYIYSPL
jgi:Flp pilus assembly protein TadG